MVKQTDGGAEVESHPLEGRGGPEGRSTGDKQTHDVCNWVVIGCGTSGRLSMGEKIMCDNPGWGFAIRWYDL